MIKARINFKYILLIAAILACALSGCATIGGVGSALIGGAVELIKLPFSILGKLIDFAGHLPMPPPWVF